MRIHLFMLTLIILQGCGHTKLAPGPGTKARQDSLVLKRIVQAMNEQRPRTLDEQKLEGSLLEILRLSEQADSSSEKAQQLSDWISHSKELAGDPQGRIRVIIEFPSVDDAHQIVDLVRSVGGVIESEGWIRSIACRIQPKELRTLIADGLVLRMRIAQPGQTR